MYLASLVTEEFIVHQLEGLFNARFGLKRFSVSILSGGSLEIEELAIAPRDRFANQAVPLDKRPPLRNKALGMKNLDLHLDLFKLLDGLFHLKGFVLKQPQIHMVLYTDGGNNLSPLFKPPPIVKGKANPKLKAGSASQESQAQAQTQKEKEEKPQKQESAGKSQPLKAQDIPLAASLGKIGIEGGEIELTLQQTGDKLRIQGLDFLVKNIEFDPADLINKNSADINFNMELLLFTKAKKESGRFLFVSGGRVVPFNRRTGRIDPNIVYELLVKRNSYVAGFSVLEKLSGKMDLLKKAGISLAKLKEKAVLSRDTKTRVSYSRGVLTILMDTVFATKEFDFSVQKGARFILTNLSHSMRGAVRASKENSDRSLKSLDKAIQRNLKMQPKEAQELRNKHFQGIIKEGRIFLPFRSQASLRDPDITLEASLPSLSELAKDAGKSLLKKEGEKAKKKLKKKAQDKLKKEGQKLLKKLF